MGVAAPGSGPEASLLESTRPFEVLESRLRPPRINDRRVLRSELIERLNGAVETPIVVVCAGPGYGKTTALAQWAASRPERPCAWVSIDVDDNDPVVLLTYIAVALDRMAPIDAGVFEALASPEASIEGKIIPRLGAALSSLDDAVLIVLDDVHAIENPRCVDAIVALAEHLPEGSQLALSARDHSALPLGLLRARALTLELGPDDLRMEPLEAHDLLRSEAVDCSDEDLAELVRRTEGWPAGLYLAALSTKQPAPRPAASARSPATIRWSPSSCSRSSSAACRPTSCGS